MPNRPLVDYNIKWLFHDPLKEDEKFKDLCGPIVIAREMREYINKYKLIIGSEFNDDYVKGASYYMTPDPNSNAWLFNNNGEKVYLKISTEIDNNGENLQYYEIPKNSLVFIRLHQIVRLPFYIIGRFNLQVTYAYKGLLLGTGPQVDPGFFDRFLNIPLHNFTNNVIKIYLYKPFVTIDFVRTSSLKLPNILPESLESFLKEGKWKCLRKALKPLPLSKYERDKIEDYLGDDRPTSSLKQLVIDLENDRNDFQKLQQRVRYDIYAVLIALFINIFSVIGLYFGMTYHFDAKFDKKIDVMQKEVNADNINQIKGDILDLRRSITQLLDEKNYSRREIEKNRERFEKMIDNLENKIRSGQRLK